MKVKVWDVENIHRKFHPDKQQQLPVTNLGHEPYSYQIRPRSKGHEPVTAPKLGHAPKATNQLAKVFPGGH